MPTVMLRDEAGRFVQEPLPELPGAEQEAWEIANFLDSLALVGEHISTYTKSF